MQRSVHEASSSCLRGSVQVQSARTHVLLDGGGDWFISIYVTVASDEKQMNFNKSFFFVDFCVACADCNDFSVL